MLHIGSSRPCVQSLMSVCLKGIYGLSSWLSLPMRNIVAYLVNVYESYRSCSLAGRLAVALIIAYNSTTTMLDLLKGYAVYKQLYCLMICAPICR